MSTAETIESFLIRAGVDYDTVDNSTWVLHDEMDHIDNIVVQDSDPVVVFSIRLMDVPSKPETQRLLFQKLLELNASEMVSGAYGLESGGVVVTETLQSENLDFNEFQAAIDGMTLAIAEHYHALKGFHEIAASEVE